MPPEPGRRGAGNRRADPLLRKGRRLILRGEEPAPAKAVETEEERAERWRRFWAEPPLPGWEDVDLSFEALDRASKEYWKWDGEPELDR